MFNMRRSKFAVKELQGLPRILDTLAYAYEFITMPTPSEQAGGLDELRRSILRLYPEIKVRLTRAFTSPASLISGNLDFRASCFGSALASRS